MSEFLVARDLCKSYTSGGRPLQILHGLTLRVAEGESVAVVGESGSGKSTLLNLLGAMDRPDGGEVCLGGRNLYAWSGEQLAEFRNRNLGFVFQFHHLLPEFTALENVAMPQLIRRCPPAVALAAGKRLLEELGLGPRGHHRPGELSGGEQQRVALARALAGHPKLLLADEPTGNLDPATAEGIEDLVFDVHRSRGLTTVLVTHSPRLAARCDHILRLANGRLDPL